MVRHCRCHPEGLVIFSPMKSKWLAIPKTPNDECFLILEQVSFAINDELFVYFISLSKFTLWKFSLRSWSWVKCEDMYCPRRSFASGSLNGIAIVAGGTDRNSNILASVELYDSSTGTWKNLPDMHTPRTECSGFFMDGKFYVIGGISNHYDPVITCGEEFDMETMKWRKIEGMYPRMYPTVKDSCSFAVVNDELYTNEYLSYVVKKYNKTINKWVVMGRLPPMVDASNIKGIKIKACGDQLLVFCEEPGGKDKGIVVNACCPKSGVKGGNFDWKVIGTKVNFGVCMFSYINTVMGC